MHETPRIRPVSPPLDIPVFNCVIYLTCSSDGVTGRVANVAEMSAEGGKEADLLRQLVAMFKECLRVCERNGSEVPWIEPPPSPRPDEVVRMVAVHL